MKGEIQTWITEFLYKNESGSTTYQNLKLCLNQNNSDIKILTTKQSNKHKWTAVPTQNATERTKEAEGVDEVEKSNDTMIMKNQTPLLRESTHTTD